MKKYVVQTLVTFVEYHVVESDDAEKAKMIALNSDYNTSIHIDTKVIDMYEMNETDLKRLREKDEYFFEGYARVDDDGFLYYMKNDGTVNGNMKVEKIF